MVKLTMKTKFFSSILAFTLLMAPRVLAETYNFDEGQSEIGFKIGHFGGQAKGVFKEFKGTLEFDEKNPQDSKVDLVIQVDSIDTGSAKRDAHLQREEYFDSGQFPTITFESRAFRKRGSVFFVTGPLTIHGVEKNITLKVRLKGRQAQWTTGGDALTFESQYELSRLDFGVSGGQPAVGKTVEIDLNIKAFEET